MHDALFADQGRLEDPHLWARAERLGLDIDRFEADRRGAAVAERIQRDFDEGLRAGVVTTPAGFVRRAPEGPATSLYHAVDLIQRVKKQRPAHPRAGRKGTHA